MQLQKILNKILKIKNQRVILDFDLAKLYEVDIRVLNQVVKQNIKLFSDGSMFQLISQEWEILKSQFVISKQEKRGGTQKLPFAFTEQGLIMLSGVINSNRTALCLKNNYGTNR